MDNINIYVPLWNKYKPVIIELIENSISNPASYKLFPHEFENIGNRISSGYQFNLELINGMLKNNIDGSAVARDLYKVMVESPTAQQLLKNKHIKISLTQDFILKVQTK